MRFVSEQRFNDENLVWQDAITEADRIIDQELFEHAYYKIVDADGVVYTGIIKEDGRVDDGYTTWDRLDTYERFDQPAKVIADKHSGRHRETLYGTGTPTNSLSNIATKTCARCASGRYPPNT